MTLNNFFRITTKPSFLCSQIVVGSGKGRMLLFDFRQLKVIHAYRGFTGAIRHVICHPTKPYVVSVGLDRFARVHSLDRQSPLYKVYLKSRLNTVLMRRDFSLGDDVEGAGDWEKVNAEKDLWNNMEVIGDQTLTEGDEKDVDTSVTIASPTKASVGTRKRRKPAN